MLGASMNTRLHKLFAVVAFGLLGSPVLGQALDGTWIADRDRSVDNDPWRHFEVTLAMSSDSVTIDRFWRGSSRYTQRDSITVPLAETVEIPVRPGKWMYLVHIGVFVPDDTTRSVTADVSKNGNTLTVTTEMPLQTSQGGIRVTIVDTYSRDSEGNLILVEKRSTRHSGPELRYVMKRR